MCGLEGTARRLCTSLARRHRDLSSVALRVQGSEQAKERFRKQNRRIDGRCGVGNETMEGSTHDTLVSGLNN